MASSIGDAQALSLARLIHETTGKLVQQYNSAGYSLPSIDSTDAGPFDAPGEAPADLARNMRIIQGACAQLSAVISRPSLVVNNKSHSFMESACLRVVYEAKIADYLLNTPNGIHINELAAKCRLDAGKLGRVLRFLATMHCFREVKHDVFANNRISIQLCSDNPLSSYAGYMTNEGFTAGGYLSDTIPHPGPETEPSLSAHHIPFRKAFASSFYDFFLVPSNAARKERFAKAMVALTEITAKYSIAQAIPWASEAESGTTICDFAGGDGHITLDLAKKFPGLHVIVQDSPEVIEHAKQYWNENLPDAVKNNRVQFIGFDFFKDSPAAGCKWYLLSHILHNWPDAECVKILSNVHKAMSPDSRLLIFDFVLQHAVRETETEKQQAPEPMLGNYGLGGILQYQQDMMMMVLLNSKERKLEEFVSLAAKAGFKYERLLDVGEESVVEFSAIQGFCPEGKD